MADSTDRSLISAAQLNRHRVGYRVVLTLVVVIFTLIFIGPLYFLFADGLKSTQSVEAPSVEAQPGEPASMLELYRRALRVRWAEFVPAAGLAWRPAPDGVLAFDRGGVACVANLSAGPVELPGGEVLLASGPLAGRLLPPDTSAWLRTVSR